MDLGHRRRLGGNDNGGAGFTSGGGTTTGGAGGSAPVARYGSGPDAAEVSRFAMGTGASRAFNQRQKGESLSESLGSRFLTYTDKFDSECWLLSTSITGRWQHGAWGFRPSASVAYMQDTAQSYTDTFGVVIPQVRSTLGLAKAGPEFSYTFEPAKDWKIEPRVGAQVLWNFAGETTATGLGSVGGEQAGPSGARGRAELGLKSRAPSGVSVDLSGSYDGIGIGGYNAVTGRAAMHVPF